MFTEPDTWNGGNIELLVALGPSSAERRLGASRAVWRWSALRGPYPRRDVEPGDQQLVANGTGAGHYYGVATLPRATGDVAFATCFVEDDDGLWLYAGSPLGSLGTVLPVGAFPFGGLGSAAWELTVYEWLFGLAQHLFAEVPFERAVVGWLTTLEVEQLAQAVVPEQRGHAYIVVSNGRPEYLAPNLKSALLT